MTVKVYNIDTNKSYIYENAGICDGIWNFEVFDLDTHEVLVSCSYLRYDWRRVRNDQEQGYKR